MEQAKPILVLGIDIGTTTVSGSLVDLANRRQCWAETLPNDSFLSSAQPDAKEQDPERIAKTVCSFLDSVLETTPDIRAIGFTGQMHGILYVGEDGLARSPLYTWQDERAARRTADGRSCCDEIREKTGEPISPGYGLATHYYNQKNGLVPQTAAKLCTIADYIAMRIAGRAEPVLHTTNAASLGLFDLVQGSFDAKKLAQLGMDTRLLPCVTGAVERLGEYRGIPVYTAVGDNQAGVFGSLQNEDDLLVNYGTGSQISRIVDAPVPAGEMELRPYLNGKYLLSGAALCGGRAYALLRDFFAAYNAEAGAEVGDGYAVLNRLAAKAYAAGQVLQVSTTFCGTRTNPAQTGSITGIGDFNFRPECLVLGVLQGMVDELYDLYSESGKLPYREVVASGNGVRKNPILQKLLEQKFKAKLKLPSVREEAAFGAALAAAEAGGLAGRAEIRQCIQYSEREQTK